MKEAIGEKQILAEHSKNKRGWLIYSTAFSKAQKSYDTVERARLVSGACLETHMPSISTFILVGCLYSPYPVAS